MPDMQKKIGERIRMYRKMRQMSLEELAAKVYKSKSIVSKYELGESVFDMDTFYKIANALRVSPADLLVPQMTGASQSRERYGIFANNVLYAYMLVRDGGYRLINGLFTFGDGESSSANFYMQVPDFDHYMNCRVLYSGTLQCHPNNAVITLVNQADYTDHAFFSAAVRSGNVESGVGMAMMSSYSTNDPGALKVLFAKKPFEREEDVIEFLTVKREDFDSIKRSNIYGYRLGSMDHLLFNK